MESNRNLFKSEAENRSMLVGGYSALADWMKCCPRSKTMEGYSETLAAWVVISITCNNWGCPICGRKKVQHYAQKVTAAKPNRLITLTVNPATWENPRAAYDGTRRAIPKLCVRLRKMFGEFEFFRVLEVTKKGWPHYHLVTRSEYIPQADLSREWNRLTGAPIVDVRKMHKSIQAYWYVVKYLAKQEMIPWTNRRAAWTRKFFMQTDFKPSQSLHLMGQRFVGARADNHCRWVYTGCTLERYSDTCWIVRGRGLNPAQLPEGVDF